MSGRLLYILVGSVCVGVALQLLFVLDVRVALGLLCFSIVALIIGHWWREWVTVSLICRALFLGLFRTQGVLVTERAHTVLSLVGKNVELFGVVSDMPDVRDIQTQVPVVLTSASTTGTVLALLPTSVHVAYGDTLTLKGSVAAPEAFLTNTDRVFDYPNYLHAHGIDVVLKNAHVENQTAGGPSLLRGLFAVREVLDHAIDKTFSIPQGALLQGLLLGERRGLPPELMQAFVSSGLVHIVALSGYNVGVVSEAIFRTFAFLPRTLSFGFGGVAVALFALMVGAGASTARASVMALTALMARYFHRKVLALRTLALATLGMVLWNPLSLLYDPSFQLSVLATFGLITLGPSVEARLPAIIKKVPTASSILGTTIAVQIYTLPALLYITGVLSVVALPANALVLPVVPVAMGLGFFATMCALVSPALATIPAMLAQASLGWIVATTQTAAALPYAAATVPPFGVWIVLLVYIPLTWFAIRMYRKSNATQK